MSVYLLEVALVVGIIIGWYLLCFVLKTERDKRVVIFLTTVIAGASIFAVVLGAYRFLARTEWQAAPVEAVPIAEDNTDKCLEAVRALAGSQHELNACLRTNKVLLERELEDWREKVEEECNKLPAPLTHCLETLETCEKKREADKRRE
jgi:hypothetical protein